MSISCMRAWMAVPALVVLASLLSVAHAEDVYDQLKHHVLSHGGLANVVIGLNKDGVRGIFTSVDVKEGQTLATIPSSVMINCGDMNSSVAQATLTLLREMKDPHSRHLPYLQVLPAPDQVINACNLPQHFIPLLESAYWEQHVRDTQAHLEAVLNGQANPDLEMTLAEAVGGAEVTLDDLRYACALASSRVLVAERRRRLMMIPLFDMANHWHDCPHDVTPLDGHTQVSLTAGRDMKAGDEYCFQYLETLHDDYAVVSYGFLPAAVNPPRLMQVDHHLFDPEGDNYDLQDVRFTDNATQVAAELERQQNTLKQLALNDEVRPAGPQPGTDPVYDLLIGLQQRRRQALRYEISRLQGLLQAPASGDKEL